MVHQSDLIHLGKSLQDFRGRCESLRRVYRLGLGHDGSIHHKHCQHVHLDCVQFLLSNAQQEVCQSDLE